MNVTRWQDLMRRWQFDDNAATFSTLQAAYQQSHRYYHNASHITAVLRHYDNVANIAKFPEELELALWFHDAIYQVTSSNNEKASAEWAIRFLKENQANGEQCHRVFRLVMVTCHNAAPQCGDESLMVDIDLSILGAESKIYQQFEANVRREYRWVPWFLYRKKRREILEAFAASQPLYYSDYFRQRFETQAKDNLAWAIEQLR